MSEIRLAGCVPDRLLTYLTALGALRTVVRQRDGEARGAWVGGEFVLETRLTRDDLERFFLDDYQPAPLVMPWNSGAFSAGKDDSAAGRALALLERSQSDRLASFRSAAQQVRALLSEFQESAAAPGGHSRAKAGPADRGRKKELLRRCRNELPDDVVEWIDAAVVLTSDGEPEYPPLLGSGGNDGRMDFTSNYMQRLAEVMPADVGHARGAQLVRAREQSGAWLLAALFAEGDVSLRDAAVGQFDPGSAGGPNSVAGFSAASVVNPWQYVLALEGSLLLAAAATRRMRAGGKGLASIPFTVRPLAVGYASAAEAEASNKSRAELWLPIWSHGWTLSETEQVFGEGRLSVGRNGTSRQAGDPIDVVRAIGQLGIDRGIDAFARFSFLQRSGNAYFAVYAGQVRTKAADARVGLLGELGAWHSELRRASTTAGAGFGTALRRLEEAMFCFAQMSSEDPRLLDLLGAIGRMEQASAQYAASALRKDSAARVPRPLQGLGPDWVADRVLQFTPVRIALALASIQRGRNKGEPSKIGALRSHLEPVEEHGRGWDWMRGGRPSVVWGGGDLTRNLCAIFERRVTEALQHDEAPAPLGGRVALGAEDVAHFLEDESNDAQIADLLWAFVGLSDRAWIGVGGAWFRAAPSWRRDRDGEPALPPNAYTLLKLTVLPRHPNTKGSRSTRSWQRQTDEADVLQTFEPRVVWLLKAGRVREALELAGLRLRVAGLPALSTDFLWPASGAARLEAALLLPASTGAIRVLEARVLAPPTDDGHAAPTAEGGMLA